MVEIAYAACICRNVQTLLLAIFTIDQLSWIILIPSGSSTSKSWTYLLKVVFDLNDLHKYGEIQ